MKLENLERAKELVLTLVVCENVLKDAKDKTLELKKMELTYDNGIDIVQNTVRNKRILSKLHELYVIELEHEIAELKAELETL
jgi:hypothetical protein